MNPKAIGEVSEAVILAHLVKEGKTVLVPFGNNQRYDLGVEENGRLTRIQVKTGKLRRGCVVFSTSNGNPITKKKRGYKGQIDEFMVYCPQNGEIYRVPVDDVGETSVLLRVDPPKSKNNAIRWAHTYKIS
jgi:hypothetical protein